MREKPLLLCDIDGVISLWGFDPDIRPAGTFCSVDGHVHFLSTRAAGALQELSDRFRPRVVQRLGGEGRRAPARTSSAFRAACRT